MFSRPSFVDSQKIEDGARGLLLFKNLPQVVPISR